MKQFFKDQQTLQRLQSGPLEPYLGMFVKQLSDQGYSWKTGRAQIRVIHNFGQWLELNDINVRDIMPEHLGTYLGYRLRKWRPGSSDARALNHLLNILRQEGVIAERPPTTQQPFEWLSNEFSCYLEKERGLGTSSIVSYVPIVERFLAHRFRDLEVDVSTFCATDVIDFVQSEALRLSRKSAKLVTVAMRSFLQFLRYQGYTDMNLDAAVPTVANWSMATIPKSFPTKLIKTVLSHCDRNTVVGRRDFAILLLLARLGLRAGEIVRLALEDIDWSSGCITITGKGQCSQLPLPIEVGEAIADYLQTRTPCSSNRRVFLSSCAPVKGFKGSASVSAIVRRALARAGIDSLRKGAHQFRHSLATEMLRRGSSLSEIGELLRHRSPQVTTIYAKVDLVPLRKLALAWPGGTL